MESEPATPPEDFEVVPARIRWLLDSYWGGNISQMARDTGVSHTALSRVLAGQMPSGRLLSGLAASVRDAVDIAWVLTGKRTRGYNSRGFPSGDTCPVSRALLSGEPRHFPHLLTAVAFALPTPWLVGCAYWWPVPNTNRVVEDDESGLRPEDYALIETSPKAIRRTEDWLGMLIVVKDAEGGAFLAKVELDTLKGPRFPFGLVLYLPRKASRSRKAREVRPRPFPRALLRLDRKRPKAAQADGTALPVYYIDDIIGVVVQLLRHNPRATVPPLPAAEPEEEAESED